MSLIAWLLLPFLSEFACYLRELPDWPYWPWLFWTSEFTGREAA